MAKSVLFQADMLVMTSSLREEKFTMKRKASFAGKCLLCCGFSCWIRIWAKKYEQ
jgi:hypothetical protein